MGHSTIYNLLYFRFSEIYLLNYNSCKLMSKLVRIK